MAANEIVDFYQTSYDESARLTKSKNEIEFLRTIDVLTRFLRAGTLRVLDIGGGAGVYAGWLAEQGHEVVLIDPVQRHVDAASHLESGSVSARLGDAQSIDEADNSFDAVLMLGPLYHLPERADRVEAWSEARRVCRDGGQIFAAVISRFASLHDMLIRNKLHQPGIAAIVAADLRNGQHRNPDKVEGLFTTAYFHHPDEIVSEAASAGVEVGHVIGIEGMAGYANGLHERLVDAEDRKVLLDLLRGIEQDRTIIGLSNHIMAIANV